ncbi:MAG: D-alanyl-D-alanine carboxypeptidase family protein [Oscillospiraceae bacterium]|nr:D-alanyl-D-alanine carboxypeptidase family protein [Oscillospiraceae bacterium]
MNKNANNNPSEDAKKNLDDLFNEADLTDETADAAEEDMTLPEDAFDHIDEIPVVSTSFKFKNPFKKLLHAIDNEDEFAAIEEELSKDDEAEEEKKPTPAAEKPKKEKKSEPKPAEPKKETAQDMDIPLDEKVDEDEFTDDMENDEAPVKSGLLGGLSFKNPFGKKKDEDFADEEFDEDDEYEEDEYDYDDEERHVDYGRIALILTFVILGIFAIDFCRRLVNDWRNSQGLLDIQSQASSEVESMSDDESGEETATMTMITSTMKPVSGTTIYTTTITTDTGISTTTTLLDNRETSTIEVQNSLMHSGSLVLINADHQQVASPSLITFNEIPYQHLRLVDTSLQVDSSLSEPIVSWFNDFFSNTGLGNIMVYSTTQSREYAPYNASIPERTAGLSLDLSILNEAQSSHSPYTADGNYAWLSEHAADYGFIQRYPGDKTEKTGMDGLSWHFRYVGAPHAKYMKDNNLCLEEYVALLSTHPWNSAHLTTTVNGVEYEMYYVPASGTSETTAITYPVSANGATPMISGDNVGGFIVAMPK